MINIYARASTVPSKLFLGLNKKSRIHETLNYLAYTDSSTDAKGLKTVDRKKHDPYQGAIVRFKISSFTLNFEREKNYLSTLKATFWVNFFSIHSQFVLAFFFFSLFCSRTKKLPEKFSIHFRF